jgi:hypothetical protein
MRERVKRIGPGGTRMPGNASRERSKQFRVGVTYYMGTTYKVIGDKTRCEVGDPVELTTPVHPAFGTELLYLRNLRTGSEFGCYAWRVGEKSGDVAPDQEVWREAD